MGAVAVANLRTLSLHQLQIVSMAAMITQRRSPESPIFGGRDISPNICENLPCICPPKYKLVSASINYNDGRCCTEPVSSAKQGFSPFLPHGVLAPEECCQGVHSFLQMNAYKYDIYIDFQGLKMYSLI